eukprot:547699_1
MAVSVLIIILFSTALSKDASTPFKILDTRLPANMTMFGVGIYEDVLQIFDGSRNPENCWTGIVDAFTLNLTNSPLPREWQKKSIDYVPYNATLIMHQSDATMGNLVYSVNPTTNVYGDQQMLYIYNLETNEYLNEKTYASTDPKHWASSPCTVIDVTRKLLYQIGGVYEMYVFADVFIYDISHDKWLSGNPEINIARSGAGCAFDATGQSIFLFGGSNASLDAIDSIERYDVSKREWELLDVRLPVGVSPAATLLYPYDKNIYIINGQANPDFRTYGGVQIFDPQTYKFQVEETNIGRVGAAAVLYGDKCMMILGGMRGADDCSPTNVIETLNCDFA